MSADVKLPPPAADIDLRRTLMTPYRRVDEGRLDRDVNYRVTFLRDFLEFDDSALKQIHAICPHSCRASPR